MALNDATKISVVCYCSNSNESSMGGRGRNITLHCHSLQPWVLVRDLHSDNATSLASPQKCISRQASIKQIWRGGVVMLLLSVFWFCFETVCAHMCVWLWGCMYMHTRTCMHHGILGILDYHLARSFKTDSGVRASIFFLYFSHFPCLSSQPYFSFNEF